MTAPLISIVTPTYNHQRYISECIRSVLAQTYDHWQMIIVDDGSRDQTAGIVRSFAEQEPRIHFIQQSNLGIFRLHETYNKALSAASGSYVAILEGDDYWQPDKLQRQVAALESQPNCVLAWGRAMVVNEDGTRKLRELPTAAPEEKKYYSNRPAGNFLNILLYVNCIPALTLLIRRSALDQIGGFSQAGHLPLVDIPTLMPLCLSGEFYYDDLVLGAWRQYIGQTTKTHLVTSLQQARALSLSFYQSLDPELKKILTVSEKSISTYFDSTLQIAHSRMGRYKLLQKDWAGARQEYRTAIFYPGLVNALWRVRSVIGYLFSFFHWDVEHLARLLGRPNYKS